MKKLLLLICISLLLCSCDESIGYEKVKTASDAWVKENVFPLYDDARITDTASDDKELKGMKYSEDSLLARNADITWRVNLSRDLRRGTVALDPSDSVQVEEAKIKREKLGKRIAIYESYRSAIDTVLHNNMKVYYVFDVKVNATGEEDDIEVRLLLDKEANVLNPDLIVEKEK